MFATVVLMHSDWAIMAYSEKLADIIALVKGFCI